jgi:uncharacterized membrane protein YhaH (DUF805 family)
MNWYLMVLKKYAVFNGRARRKEYWMFFLFSLIISFILGIIEGVAGINPDGTESLLANVYSLAIVIPYIAVGVRRIHDIGRSGWWILFPVVNLVFFCLDSEDRENKYGSNPKID